MQAPACIRSCLGSTPHALRRAVHPSSGAVVAGIVRLHIAHLGLLRTGSGAGAAGNGAGRAGAGWSARRHCHGAGRRCRCRQGGARSACRDRAARRCRHRAVAGGRRRGPVRPRGGQARRLRLLQPGGGTGREGRVPRKRARREQGPARRVADRQQGPAGQGLSRPRHRLQLCRPAGTRRAVRHPRAEVSGGEPDPGQRPGAQGDRRRAHPPGALRRGHRQLRASAAGQLRSLPPAGGRLAGQCADPVRRPGARAGHAGCARRAFRRQATRAVAAHPWPPAARREQAGRGAGPVPAAGECAGRWR